MREQTLLALHIPIDGHVVATAIAWLHFEFVRIHVVVVLVRMHCMRLALARGSRLK